mgnify:CR=1 FL=1
MQAVLDTLRTELADRNLSQRRLSALIDRRPQWVIHHLGGAYVLSMDDYILICEGIGIDPVTTLAKALKQ